MPRPADPASAADRTRTPGTMLDLFALLSPPPGPGARIIALDGRADLLDRPVTLPGGARVTVTADGRCRWQPGPGTAAADGGAAPLILTLRDGNRVQDLALDLAHLAPLPGGSFGRQTRPGAGRLWVGAERIRFGDRGGHWRLEEGWLIPAATAGLDPRGYRLETDAGLVPIRVVDRTSTVSNTRELGELLGGRGDLSGRRIDLRPGRYPVVGDINTYNMFTGLSAPLTLASADPATPAELNGIILAGRDAPAMGPVLFEDLVFHREQASYAASNRGAHNAALVTLMAGCRGIAFTRCRFSSDLAPARRGGRMTHQVKGIRSSQVDGITIRDCLFEHLVHGMELAGRDISVTGCTGRRMWADFVSLHPRRDGTDTVGVHIANNTFHDPIGDNGVLHPDFIHTYPRARDTGAVRQVLIEGNVVFMGEEGVRQPPELGHRAPQGSVPLTGDTVLEPALSRTLVRVDARRGPVRLTLPEGPMAPDGQPIRLGIQKVDASANPVEIRPAPGGWFGVGEKRDDRILLSAQWQGIDTGVLRDRPAWAVKPGVPGLQGMFANPLYEGGRLSDWIVRGNILWINSPHGVSSIGPIDRAHVHNNTILMALPGDANGDGVANDAHDGVSPFPSGQITLSGRDVLITDNLVGDAAPSRYRKQEPPPLLRGNVTGAGTPATLLRLMGRRGRTLHPTTREEAVALARPARSGTAGAVGPTDDTGYWNFTAGRAN
ncbi:MAG: hypothetical protein AAFR57_04780 [Pseudomonadota bacterium]